LPILPKDSLPRIGHYLRNTYSKVIVARNARSAIVKRKKMKTPTEKDYFPKLGSFSISCKCPTDEEVGICEDSIESS
jgi:hypothetical protein